MPCTEITHAHKWVTEGTLIIERCEKFCEFCATQNGTYHQFGSAWFLRRHVRVVHASEYPNLIVPTGWTGKLEGNTKPNSNVRRAKKITKGVKAKSLTPEAIQQPPITTTPVSHSISADVNVTHPTVSVSHLTTNGTNAMAATFLDSQTAGNMMFEFPGFDSDEYTDGNHTSFSEFFTSMTSANDYALSDADDRSVSVSDGFINPVVLTTNAPYASISAWSTPQSVRTSNVTIEAEKPTNPMGGSPDRLIRRLNEAFREALQGGIMTDAQVLGTSTTFLDAFKHGRAF